MSLPLPTALAGPWLFVLLGLVVLVLGYGLTYFLWLQTAGRFVARRAAGADNPTPTDEATPTDNPTPTDEAGPSADPPTLYFLVACLNEAAVIGETVANLIGADPHARVVVVDDGSDDGTGEIALAAGDGRVVLVTRRAPHARRGKGEALNEGLAFLRRDARRRGIDPNQVIVCVMDADGMLSDGAWPHVARVFDDPTAGGVQLPVRIRNRNRFLTRLQDIGFWGTAAVAQFGRVATGSVSLGGNGQFTRLAALNELGPAPWSRSLTEDLDLTISLAVAGWTTRCTPAAWVEQEAPTTVRALLRQRTRWAQGHMVCAGRVGEIVSSPRVPAPAALELTAYLFQPWLATIPWSLLAPGLLVVGVAILVAIGQVAGLAAVAASLIGLYLLAFAPLVYSAGVYAARARDIGRLEALVLLHGSLLLVLIVTLATWRAAGRIAIGRNGWVKTVHVGAVAEREPHLVA